MQKSSTGLSNPGTVTFSDGAITVGIRRRLPLRTSCIHRIEPFARKRPSLQGRMSWIESGTIIGLVDKKEEYHESNSRSPVINLTSQHLIRRRVGKTYRLTDSILLQTFHLMSISGTVSKRVISRIWPSVAENSPCRCAIYLVSDAKTGQRIIRTDMRLTYSICDFSRCSFSCSN